MPKDNPLRAVRSSIDWLLDGDYSERGKLSNLPERLLRAQMLQVLYLIRSEWQMMEQIQYNLLFRWFIGLTVDDAVWNHSSFSKNRDRLLEHDVVPALFEEIITLAQAWASQKSFRPRDEDNQPPS